MRKIFVILLLVLTMVLPAAGALTNSVADVTFPTAYWWTGDPQKDQGLLWMKEIESIIGGLGTTGIDSLILIPRDTTPTLTEGTMWYNDSANQLMLRTDTDTVAIDVAGGTSLDASYDLGIAITVDAGAVALTATDAANNVVLALDQQDTAGTVAALTVASAGDAAAIIIAQTGSGGDIEGTAGWSVDATGVGTFLSFILENGGIINNTTDNEIEFIENGEQFSFAFNGNTLTYATDSGIDSIAFGVVDDLSGIANIAFDEAAGGISLNGTTNGWDLTIAQTGTVDSSLILSSAGSITDALSLITTDAVGVIKISSSDILDVDSVDDMKFDLSGAGANFDVDSAAGSIYLDSGEADAKAIWLATTNAAGGLDIDVGSGSLDIDVTGGDITIDNSGAGKNLDIDITAGSIYLDSGEAQADAIKIGATNAAGGVDLDSGTGGFTIDSTGVLSLDAADDINLTITSGTAAEDLTIAQVGANDSSIIITAAGTGTNAIEITTTNAAGDIDINAGDAITIDAGDIVITTDDAAANQFKVDATGTIAGIAIQFKTSDGGIHLNADGAGNGDITLDAADDLIITVVGTTSITGVEKIIYTGVFYANDRVVEVHSTSSTLDTGADVGTLMLVDTAAVVITLPAVATGLDYTIMNIGVDGTEIHVDVNSSDRVLGGCGFTALDDGDKLTNTGATADKGDYVRYRYGTAVGWYLVEMNGIWADGG